MNAKLSDLVILSDVDGTLVHKNQPVPGRNVEALERFVSKGGRFAIATGRSCGFTRPLAESLPVNFPCVIFNGGAIYDYGREEYLMEIDMPEETVRYMEEIRERFPQCALVAVNREDYLDIDGSAERNYRGVYSNRSMIPTALSEVEGKLLKSLMFLSPEFTGEFYGYVSERAFKGVRFVSTNAHLIEMIPEGSSKGGALRWITKHLGVARENMVAIGDYYNDREMIEEAGLGATMHTSPEDLKAIAQILVCDCREGSLGDLVEQLEARFG